MSLVLNDLIAFKKFLTNIARVRFNGGKVVCKLFFILLRYPCVVRNFFLRLSCNDRESISSDRNVGRNFRRPVEANSVQRDLQKRQLG